MVDFQSTFFEKALQEINARVVPLCVGISLLNRCLSKLTSASLSPHATTKELKRLEKKIMDILDCFLEGIEQVTPIFKMGRVDKMFTEIQDKLIKSSHPNPFDLSVVIENS